MADRPPANPKDTQRDAEGTALALEAYDMTGKAEVATQTSTQLKLREITEREVEADKDEPKQPSDT